MAKVLLINPKIPSVSKKRIVFPTGLLWIGSFLEQNGHEAKIINAHNQDDYLDIIKREINSSTCVGISAMTAQVPNALEISDFIKEIDSSIPIVWGGVHPTLFLGQTCTDENVDISVKGEGEHTLLEIIKYVEGSADLKDVDGVSYFDKKNNKVVETKDRKPINMDELHSIKWSLLHKDILQQMKDFEVPVQTSRGCPHRCTFCLPKGTLVLMSDITWKPIEKIKIGDYVIGIKKSIEKKRPPKFVKSKVTHTFKRNVKLKKIVTTNGTVFSTEEHPWLSEKWRWRKTSNLKKGQILRKISTPSLTGKDSIDYKRGYLIGVMKGDGCFRNVHHKRNYGKKDYYYWNFRLVTDYESMYTFQNFARELGVATTVTKFNPGNIYKVDKALYVQNQKNCKKLLDLFKMNYTQREMRRGFLAGIYDSEGSWSKVIRISNLDESLKKEIGMNLKFFGFKYKIEKKAVRLLGGQSENIRFISFINPKVTHKKRGLFKISLKVKPTKIKGIYDDKTTDVYNLETTSRNFIADGFVTHNCINVATKNPFRFRSIERVFSDLEDVQKFGVKKIRFRDENFFVNAGRVEKIADGMIERGFDFEWYGSIRVNYFKGNQMNMERLKKIKKAGCRYFGFGAESGSQRVLNILKKDITIEDTINSAKISKKIGIVPVYSFMIGIPGETKNDMMKTVNLIDKLIGIYPSAKIVGPQVFRPYPGGELYETCLKLGWKEPAALRGWVEMVMSDAYFADVRNLPWVENPDLVETISYSSYWTNNLKEVLKNKSLLLKILTGLYHLDSKIRWKTRFFSFPVDMKLKNFMNKYRAELSG